MLHALNKFGCPDLARNDEGDAWRVDHHLFFGDGSIAFVDRQNFAGGVKGGPRANDHEGERTVKMVVRIGDVRMVVGGTDVF